MSVYVDALMDWGWKYGKSCHLMADTEKELHDFARSIGLKRGWYQTRHSPHYDLTERRRIMAVSKGATEVDRRKAVEIWKLQRTKLKGGEKQNGNQ